MLLLLHMGEAYYQTEIIFHRRSMIERRVEFRKAMSICAEKFLLFFQFNLLEWEIPTFRLNLDKVFYYVTQFRRL